MQVFHHTTRAMGTRFNMVLPMVDDDSGESIGREVNGMLEVIESTISCHRENSELTGVNRSAYNGWIRVSERLAPALDSCQWFWEQTAGAFDPGLYKITQRVRDQAQATPHLLGDLMKQTGWNQVEWDASSNRIRFNAPDVGIDMGGLGKGWALEFIIKMLKGKGITSAFISFGESSMATIGTHPLSQKWEISIQHPITGTKTVLGLNDDSVSISGLKRIRVNAQEQYIPHIVSPSNASLVEDGRMVVVQSQSPLRAEALSTALVAASKQQVVSIIESFPTDSILICADGAKAFVNNSSPELQ